jgi:hypothetical protein
MTVGTARVKMQLEAALEEGREIALYFEIKIR